MCHQPKEKGTTLQIQRASEIFQTNLILVINKVLAGNSQIYLVP